ncbi:MAG: hypothetical protein ACRC6P_03980 [Shewanella oncorhynchi]
MRNQVAKNFSAVDLTAFKTALLGEQWQSQQTHFEQIHCQFLRIVLGAMGELKEPVSLSSVSFRLENDERLFDDFCTHLVATVSLQPALDLSKIEQIHNSLGDAPVHRTHLNKRTRALISFFEHQSCTNTIFLVLAHFLKLDPRYRRLLCIDAQKEAKVLLTTTLLNTASR